MKTRFLTAAAIAALTATAGVAPAIAADQTNDLEGMYYMGERHQQPSAAQPGTGNGTMAANEAASTEVPPRYHPMMPPTAHPLGAPDQRTVMIGSDRLVAKDVLGRPVVTPSGTPFGEITAVRGQGPAEKDLIIRVDKAHWAKGMTFPKRDTTVPLITGDGRAAVRADAVRLFVDGRSIVVERSSLRPIGS